MNTQFESKADGPRRTTPRMTKTFCDILSDSLPESKKTETYPVSDVERNRLATQLDSDKETESEKKSTSIVTIKRERQSTSQRLMEQFSKDELLPFQ